MKKVIIAMSGGLDSSVAAALVKERGMEAIGVFMRLYPGSLRGSEKRARKVAKILGIPFYVLNFEKEFERKVIDYFLEEYKKGRTPNPCIVCNKEIKFGLLLKQAMALRADFVATGHYARKQRTTNNEQRTKYKLLRGKDKGKDQSYFLWQLNQEQLKHILFPLGDYTKREVRNLAKKFKLPVLDIPESQEICFVKNNVNDFLKKYLKEKPGDILNKDGRKIGRHQGLFFYTIGQRKGLNLPVGPWFVLGKDTKKNFLIVTKNEKDLLKKELIAENLNWISGKEPKLPLKVKAKIRYRHKVSSATIYHLKSNIYHLIFIKPQQAVTSGQSVVFYKGEELLGGGVICD